MKDNIVEDFHTLMADLDLLIKKYQGKTSVPKRLAYALCDISADFSFNENFYSKEEAIAIEDMGIQIMEKVCEFYQRVNLYPVIMIHIRSKRQKNELYAKHFPML